MSNFWNRLLGRKEPEQQKALLQPVQIPGNPAGFQFFGGQLIPYKTDKQTYIHKAYLYNDMIYSVVKIILDKAVQPSAGIYRIQDRKAFKHYSGIVGKMGNGGAMTTQERVEFRDVRSKALELYTDDEYLNQLIEYPNASNQTFSDLNYALWGFKLITGDYYEAGWDAFSGGLNAGKPMGMYELPSQYMSIIASRGLPMFDAGYQLTIGSIVDYSVEDVLHEKYWNPDWDIYGNQLYGLSPVKAALTRLLASNEGLARQAKAMNNAGSDVLVYMDDPNVIGNVGFSEDQIGAMKRRWDDEQSGTTNAGKAVWSAYKMGVARLGLSPVELNLLDLQEANQRYFANLYGVPTPLLNDSASSTYNNRSEAEKALTIRCAIPLNVSRQRSFNRKLQQLPAYQGKGLVMEFDLSQYQELEVNKTELVTWMNQAPITNRRKLELLGEDVPDTMTEEEQNAILIPSGQQLLADLVMPPTTDNTDIVDQLTRSGSLPYPIS